MSFKERQERFGKAKSRRVNWEDTYQDALVYTAQHRDTFDLQEKGRKQYTETYDSTAQAAVLKFSSNLQSGLVPPFKKWVRLSTGAEIPEESIDQAAGQLDLITNTMFKYLHSSNFDTQISEAFVDLAMGTGAILVNEGDDANPLVFTAIPLSELYLEEGPHGTIKTVFRHFKMPARNIKATWEKANIPDQLDLDKKPDEEVEILESTIYDAKTKKYTYCVDLPKFKAEAFTEELKSSPWIVFRWSVMPGEVYGRGPMLSALPDVKTLNKTVEFLLKSAAFKMIPTFIAADDGIINPYNIKIEPGAIIPSAPFGPGGPPLQPLSVGGDVNLGQFVIERMQARIDDMMFTNAIGDVNLPVKTATEVSIRQQELAKRIGSSFGRLQFEFIAPLINRVLEILDSRGLLPVSLSDVKVDGKVISLAHQSPLAQAQEEEELVNVMRYRDDLMQTVGPEMMPLFLNIEEYSKMVAEGLNVPAKLIPDEAQRAQAAALMGQVAGAAQQEEGSGNAQLGPVQGA